MSPTAGLADVPGLRRPTLGPRPPIAGHAVKTVVAFPCTVPISGPAAGRTGRRATRGGRAVETGPASRPVP